MRAARIRHWRWSGWDLEVGITVAAAFVIAVLNLLSAVDANVVSAATLGMLAVLSFDILMTRHRSERDVWAVRRMADTVAEACRPSADRLISVAGLAHHPNLGGAREVRLAGVTLSRTIRAHLPALEQCLWAGGSVRIAVIDPGGTVADEAARRDGLPGGGSIFRHRLRASVDLLRHLAGSAGDAPRLYVRSLSFVPSFGLVIADHGTGDGMIAVEMYSHQPGGREPALLVTAARDPVSFHHFQEEFEQLWAAGHPVDLRPYDPRLDHQ